MRIEIKRDPGRWFTLPWACWLYRDDGHVFLGMGVGATRNSAIRRAFSNAAERVIKPPVYPDPIHVEEIKA